MLESDLKRVLTYFFVALALSGMCWAIYSQTDVRIPTVKVKEIFNHPKHLKAFKSHGVQCLDCHISNLMSGIKTEKDYRQVNAQFKDYIYKTCHYCHNNPEKNIQAPNRCTICHTDIDSIRPTNHNYFWKNSHALNAKFDPISCKKCHLSSFCINCHKSKRDLGHKSHPGNFIRTHSIEARGFIQTCTHCHQVSFCINCHSRRN